MRAPMKNTFLSVLFSIGWLTLSSMSFAQPMIHSAVSEQFPEGLHSQLIQYVARHLDVEVTISTMPYARRLMALENGTIDLMVGISGRANIGPNVYRIEPPYETISASVFTLTHNLAQFNDRNVNATLAITRFSNKAAIYEQLPNIKLVSIETLDQKIEMLLKGRIGAFLHVHQSAMSKIKATNNGERIKPVELALIKAFGQYIAVNKNSWLFNRKEDIKAIISTGIRKGHFKSIRETFYANR